MFRTKRSEGVTIVETVDDMRSFYYSADILLAPIRIGSGTKFKILEAMACGLPVVTTDVGIEGIKSALPIAIIANDAVELAAASNKLAVNQELRRRLSVAARKTIEDRFDWRAIGATLDDAYERIINHHS